MSRFVHLWVCNMGTSQKPSIYGQWEVERWETPLSDVARPALLTLHDADELSVVIEGGPTEGRRIWKIVFRQYLAYLNLDESYRLGLWHRIGRNSAHYGATLRVVRSPWLASLIASEPTIEDAFQDLVHYQIITGDDVIDVVAPSAPTIRQLRLSEIGDIGALRHYSRTTSAKELQQRLSRERSMALALRQKNIDVARYSCLHDAYYSNVGVEVDSQTDRQDAILAGFFSAAHDSARRGPSLLRCCPICGTYLEIGDGER